SSGRARPAAAATLVSLREHSRDLPLGSAVDTRVGPARFPVVQVGLGFLQAFEAWPLSGIMGQINVTCSEVKLEPELNIPRAVALRLGDLAEGWAGDADVWRGEQRPVKGVGSRSPKLNVTLFTAKVL